MNGSKSPEAAAAPADTDVRDYARSRSSSPVVTAEELRREMEGGAQASIEKQDTELPDAPVSLPNSDGEKKDEGKKDDEDANSEAETVLTSPVKKREAEKQGAVKTEGGDVPMSPVVEDAEEDDDDADAPGSPDDDVVGSTMASGRATPREREDKKNEDDKDGSSESLSDIDPSRESHSGQSSRDSSRSRAHSERPDTARSGHESPNPRKRKHRASSVSLPNKRPSMDAARQKLRGLAPEGANGERSPPAKRSHRRATSMQIGFMDGAAEGSSARKRRANMQFNPRDAKPAKATWDESSVSSETTSYGHGEQRRPQRGMARSTSTPGGRTGGREHKRHINKYGFTKVAEACELDDLDAVRDWLDKDPDQLELAEFAGNTPLQIAAINGNADVVKYLIEQGCRVDCANLDKDTPLIDAAENGHLDVVEILLQAGVDPLRQNLKGQQAMDVIGDDTDNGPEIAQTLRKAMEQWNSDDAKQRRVEEEEQRYRAGGNKHVDFMARTYENLLTLVTNNDRKGVQEFLDARVPVDNAIVAAGAKTGDTYLVNMLLAEMTEKKAFQKPEKPMLAVLGTSHFDMLKFLTQLEQFNPLWLNRQKKTWAELAEEKRGPMWKQEVEILQKLYDDADAEKKSRDAGRDPSTSPVAERKREQPRRRPALHSEDNSGEDDDGAAPRRKNGRRLMSRRDMRAASGRMSDTSSDESSSETAKEADERMKPPESPNTRRATRQRTKSLSHPADTEPKEEKKHRRRSSSLRDKPQPSLEAVDETMEDADAAHSPDKVPANQEALNEKKKQDEEAAKAKADEDARKAEEEKKVAEEKKQEEARKAEEARQAEEKRKEEEAKQAEEARKAEEERKQREAAMSEAKRQHRQDFAASLPSALQRLLHPNAEPLAEGEHLAAIVLEHFTPLHAIPSTEQAEQSKSEPELYVLNAQAAPLLGKNGLDLLLSSSAPGIEESICHAWSTQPFEEADRHVLPNILPPHCLSAEALSQDEEMLDDDDQLSFAAELERTAKRVRDGEESREKLSNIELRWVKLQDVLDHLDPILKSHTIPIRVDSCHRPSQRALMLKQLDADGMSDMFDRLRAWWTSRPLRQWRDGEVKDETSSPGFASTEARVVHEK